MNDKVFVLDCDGVITDGLFWYNKDGKFLKCFGPDDFDMLKELMNFIPVSFITADKKGYSIIEKRIVQEMGWSLSLVSNSPKERWKWITQQFPGKQIIFMGDGCYDWFALNNSFFGITTKDALDYVKEAAHYVTKRSGGDRAVAEACLHIMAMFNFDWMKHHLVDR